MFTYLGKNIIRLLKDEDILHWSVEQQDYLLDYRADRRGLPSELLPVTWNVRVPVILYATHVPWRTLLDRRSGG